MNADYILTLGEFLRVKQVIELDPLTIGDTVWPPFTDIKEQLWSYMDCLPRAAQDDDGFDCDNRLSRDDFVLMLRRLYPNLLRD